MPPSSGRVPVQITRESPPGSVDRHCAGWGRVRTSLPALTRAYHWSLSTPFGAGRPLQL